MAQSLQNVKHRCSPLWWSDASSLPIIVRFAPFLFILWLAGSQFASPSLFARDATLVLDRKECEINFSLPAVLHTVHGKFAVRGGDLRLDVGSGDISGRIVADVKSGDTGEEERDRRMHQDVLESARFPEAVFSPDRLTGQLALSGRSDLTVHGILRIHGQDHELTVPVKVSVESGRFTATSRLSIPYVKWGMRDPSSLILRVSKTVEVEINLAGTIRQD
jgi:polyisoprenoid-binding protein YceI